MNVPPAIAELISAHLDGELAEDGRQRLEAWLVADPSHRRLFLRLVLEHQATSRCATTLRDQDPAGVHRPGRWRSHSWLAPAALAAGLIIALAGGLLLWSGRPPPAHAGSPDRQPILALASPAASQLGRRLPSGSTFTVADGEEATLRWEDGSVIRLDSGTQVIIGTGLSLQVTYGRIMAEIVAQIAGQPARFTTPEAEVTVLGTTLTVASAEGESRVEVSHGQVEVRRRSDGAAVVVGAGTFAVVAPGLELRGRAMGTPCGILYHILPGDPLPDQALLVPGDVIEFASGTHRGAWNWTASGTRLRPIVLRGAGTDSTVLDATGHDTSGVRSGPRAVLQVEGNFVTVEGLTLTGARNGLNAAGIRLFGSSGDLTIRACRISGCDQGIMSDSESGSLLIEDSAIVANGSPGRPGRTHNLNLAGGSCLVRGCRIGDAFAGCNLKFQGGVNRLLGNRIVGGADGELGLECMTTAPTRLELLGNLFVGTARGEAWNQSRFLFVSQPVGVSVPPQLVLRGNTFVVGDSRNMLIDAVGCDVELSGCIVTGSQHLVSAGTRLSGHGNWLPPGVAEAGLSGSRHGDPGFRDPATGDFHLRDDAPARGMVRYAGAPEPTLEPPSADGPAQPRPVATDPGAFQGR